MHGERGATRRVAVSTLAFLLVYLVSVLLGRDSRAEGSATATFWPAAGVAFVWLSRVWHRPAWRRVTAGLVVVATSVASVATGLPPVVCVAFAIAAVVQALVTCFVFVRLEPAGFRLTQPRHAWVLVVSALLGALAGAAIAFLPSSVVLGPSPTTSLFQWLARNASTVIAAGLWLLLVDRRAQRQAGSAGWVEIVLVNVGAAALFVWVFDVEHLYALSFLIVPLTVWVGSRLSLRVAAGNMLLIDVVQVFGAVNGKGPFAQAAPDERVLGVQLTVLLLSVLTILLSLHREERARLVESLRVTRHDAERQAGLLRTVFETTSDGMSVYAADGSILMANAAALAMYPTLPPGVPMERMAEFVEILALDGSRLEGGEIPIVRALRGERLDSSDMAFRSVLDGWTRTYNVAAHPLPHSEGANWSDGAIVAFRDVTENRAAAAEVSRTRDLYAGILSGATEQLIIATDLEGTIAVFNEGAERMLARSSASMTGRSVRHLHDPAEVAERAAELGIEPGMGLFTHDLHRTGGGVTRQWTLLRGDGEPRQVALTVSWIHDPEGNPTGLLGVGTDVTEQVAVQARLADSELRFRAAFDTAPVGMLLVGLDSSAGRILQVNTTMTEFTGLVPEELGVLDVRAISPVEDRDEFRARFAPLLDGSTEEAQFEHRYLRADGSSGWGRTTATRVTQAGDPYLLCLVEDVTARKEAEEALVHQAMHDALTGLPNRALLRDRLAHCLDAGRRTDLTVGVLLIDLDGFKAVNDTAGHAAGDGLLREVARRLSASSRAGDTVARLGGDEFAVVCPDVSDADLEVVAQRMLAAVREPVELPEGTFGVGASIGTATQPTRDTDPATLDKLLQNADLAMYAAKRAGKNRVYAYDDRDRERIDRAERLVPELAAALAAGEFEMFGQPIVDLVGGGVHAVETLLRWRRADGTVLTPGAFLDVLEASPLMPAAGEFVLRSSCEMAASWVAELGEGSPAVHVNVSAEQLSGDLVVQVDEVLAATGLPAHLLVLELTETHTTKITEALRADLETLRGRGVRIAIDDLGTGYSGLARLTELPVDVLKIDLQFVAGLGRDPSCDAVVRAVLGIGQALGIEVVAEGVETDLQAKVLRSYGATHAQGYRFARPAPAAELLAALRRPALTA